MLSVLYWIYCLAFAFDFRGEAGGSAVQYVFLLLAVGSGLAIMAVGYRALFTLPGVYLVLLWIGFLVLTPLVAVGQGVPIGNYIRCSLPLHFMGLSLFVMQVMAGSATDPHKLLFPLVVSGAINIFWRAVYSLVIMKIPIHEIRYELLSSAAPFFIGYAMVAFFFSQRRVPMDVLIGGGLTFGSLFVSITRSYIATAGFAFLACVALLYVSLRRRQWTVPAIIGKLKQAAGLGVIGVVMILVIAITNPLVLERWTKRLLENAGTGAETSADVSLLTRQAEFDTMFGMLSENPHTYFFGLGLGAYYQWDEAYLHELLLVWGDRDDLNEEIFFPGHSTWVYAVFSSGYLGLACYLLVFLGGLAFAWRVIWKLSFAGHPPNEFLILPMVVTLCYLSQTFTANPFIDRFAGLIIGLFLGYPQVLLNRYRFAQLSQPLASQPTMPVARMQPSPVP